MSALASLATSALLGTARHPPEWPAPEGPVGDLLGRIPRDSVEKALLQTAGVLGTCQLAGLLPAQVSSAPAPSESSSQDVRMDLLAAILADGPERLQVEAFQAIASVGKNLPHRLLPKALECGRRSTALRPSLLAVLGLRGAWLAAQNDAWAYAAGVVSMDTVSDEVWQLGSLDQRRLYLTALRATDAAQAREAAGEDGEAELSACLVLLRRRRLGPYAADGGALDDAVTDADGNETGKRHKVLAMLARAGFASEAARLALGMGREEAEDRIIALRRT